MLTCITASWRYSQRLRTLWRYLAPVQSRQQFSEARRYSRRRPGDGSSHKPGRHDQCFKCISLGSEYPPQVREYYCGNPLLRLRCQSCSVFERHHRFVGWLGLICTCKIYFYILVGYMRSHSQGFSLSSAIPMIQSLVHGILTELILFIIRISGSRWG